MKTFFRKIREWFTKDPLLEKTFKLAEKLEAANIANSAMAHDLSISMQENLEGQISADIFQQALTNVFDQEQIQKFFDEADKLREEHENEQDEENSG